MSEEGQGGGTESDYAYMYIISDYMISDDGDNETTKYRLKLAHSCHVWWGSPSEQTQEADPMLFWCYSNKWRLVLFHCRPIICNSGQY